MDDCVSLHKLILYTLHPRMLFGWNWPTGSGEDNYLIFVNVFSLICNRLPLEKGGPLHLNKLIYIAFNQGCFVPGLIDFGPVVLEKKFFLKASIYFQYFVFISPLKNERPIILLNLNSLHPKIFCAKFGWNWSTGSGVEYIQNSSMYFLLFHNYFP